MIEDIIDLPKGSIRIVDIGAAFLGENPPYQPLLDRGLATLTAFEPSESEREKLQVHLGSTATVLPYAVGDGRRHTLHVSTNAPGMTSLLERDPDTQAFFNNFALWGEVERTMPVDTVRLDDCGEVKDIDYLKMDAQGSELMILQGGQGKLSHCVVVQTEVSFITLYKLQPTFGEIDCYLRKHGFAPHCFAELKLWSIAPTVKDGNFRVPFNQLLEADAVYMRNTIHQRIEVLSLKKLAVIAHYCYASHDLAARCILDLCARGAVSANAQQRYYDSLRSSN
jgi:FkbM family methyltransferase